LVGLRVEDDGDRQRPRAARQGCGPTAEQLAHREALAQLLERESRQIVHVNTAPSSAVKTKDEGTASIASQRPVSVTSRWIASTHTRSAACRRRVTPRRW